MGNRKRLSGDALTKYARLYAMCAINEAEIKNNPLPYLKKAEEIANRLLIAIEEAIICLDGADDIDFYVKHNDMIPNISISGAVVARNMKATAILIKALDPTP